MRHGVMALGPTGSGKSTAFHLLAKALGCAHDHYYSKTLADPACQNQSIEQGISTDLPKVWNTIELSYC